MIDHNNCITKHLSVSIYVGLLGYPDVSNSMVRPKLVSCFSYHSGLQSIYSNCKLPPRYYLARFHWVCCICQSTMKVGFLPVWYFPLPRNNSLTSHYSYQLLLFIGVKWIYMNLFFHRTVLFQTGFKTSTASFSSPYFSFFSSYYWILFDLIVICY